MKGKILVEHRVKKDRQGKPLRKYMTRQSFAIIPPKQYGLEMYLNGGWVRAKQELPRPEPVKEVKQDEPVGHVKNETYEKLKEGQDVAVRELHALIDELNLPVSKAQPKVKLIEDVKNNL